MIRPFWTALGTAFGRRRAERQLDAELRFHLEQAVEQNLRQGMSGEEASREALRSFGGLELTKEECRDAWGVRILDALRQDLRFGLRNLARNPGYAVLAAATLALGIGANTAIFSLVYGVLLRPLPFAAGHRLAVLRQQAPLAGVSSMGFSCHEIDDYRRQGQSFERLVEQHSMVFILLGRAEPERVRTSVVSADFFDFLGVKPLAGRVFLSGEDQPGAEAVLVLSHAYWQRSHGGDLSVVGRTFRMNNRPHRVVGILPALPQFPDENDVYMPVSACPFRSNPDFIANRNARMMRVFGRLKPESTLETARAELATIASRLERQYPDSYPAHRGYRLQLARLDEELTLRARPTLLILLGSAGLVLLIACANVANLALARLVRRDREMAIRTALGAGRGRLARQLLTESTLLALAGGALGLLLAHACLPALVTFTSRFTNRIQQIHIDGAVLLFTLAVSIATGLLFGCLPALGPRRDVAVGIREAQGAGTTAPARQRLRAALVVCQVAISFLVLAGAGLLGRSVVKLHQVDPGFNPDRVLTMTISPNWSKINDSQRFRSFFQTALERLNSMPGVAAAAVAFKFPLDQSVRSNRNFQIEGQAATDGGPRPVADFRAVSPGYFQVLQIRLVRGRLFSGQDHERAPAVALVNQTMARRWWDQRDPIGRRVSLNSGRTWLTIVGVVGDVRQYGLEQAPVDELYLPFAQSPAGVNVLVRTASDPLAMARQLREALYQLDAESPISDLRTLEQVRSAALAPPRLTALLFALFAGLTLLITVTGLTGLISLTASQRTNEIGIRMALGASPTAVIRMLVGQALLLVLAGLALGVAAAVALSRLLSRLLFGVEPTDPLTFLGVALGMLALAAVSCAIPARRATAIDPLIALRSG